MATWDRPRRVIHNFWLILALWALIDTAPLPIAYWILLALKIPLAPAVLVGWAALLVFYVSWRVHRRQIERHSTQTETPDVWFSSH